MLRVAVSYYLILALSAGPAAFCCCALKSLAGPLHALAAEATSPASQTGDVCPHCKKQRDEQPAPPEKSPAPDKGPHDGCPCKEHGPAAALPDAVPDGARAWSPADAPSDVLSLDAVGVHSADFVAPPRAASAGLRDGPWLSAGDLLTAHHVIRC